MSSLTGLEKGKLEKLLHMSGGYVSTFSDSTFGSFFSDLDIDIHGTKYAAFGSSKAKKLRQFWTIEPDHIVGRAIAALVEREEDRSLPDGPTDEDKKLIKDCKAIASRLLSGSVRLDSLKEAAVIFDSRYINEQIRRMELSIESDPALAIGSAKELIETCCKTILADRGKPISGAPDIPVLTKE